MGYFKEHYGDLIYTIDRKEKRGLRNAQLGAIHALASFHTLESKSAAIVVMPTGAGKTAVLMMTPYVYSSEKVLVVTPSVMVRGQITEDFSKLKTLCRANVFSDSVKKPHVFEMEHKYSDDIVDYLNKADVIIATPACALSLSESEWAKNHISLVEVDEAHHTPAKTWQAILENLDTADHVLFTATPFRHDKKEIKGEMVYNYPLSKAYADGIFGEIRYIPVSENKDKNLQIALKAQEIFFADREGGFEHYLMVRTNTKDNAKELERLYAENTSLRLRRIDSSMRNTVVNKCINQLKNGELDGVICVDMLGEGFDFPNLKIAAIHEPHKSLENTLQFIGRFARTNASNIGTAKFIAANNEELEIENSRLYAKDAVWQDIIIDLSEHRNKEEKDNKEYFREFKAEKELDKSEVPLQSIKLNCHAKVYKAYGFSLNAEFPEAYGIENRIYRNAQDNTVVGIGIEYAAPKWLNSEYKIDKEYVLYIIHYQKEFGLLRLLA